jgi:hypothetical protein
VPFLGGGFYDLFFFFSKLFFSLRGISVGVVVGALSESKILKMSGHVRNPLKLGTLYRKAGSENLYSSFRSLELWELREREERPCIGLKLLDPCGLAARSDPPVVPSGPLGVSPDPPLCPPVLVVSLCPPVLLVSLLIPPRVLRCPWCLLDPTVV